MSIVPKRTKMLLPRRGKQPRRRKAVIVTVMKIGLRREKPIQVAAAAAVVVEEEEVVVVVVELARRDLG
jgi:hypothetical protein